MASSTKNNILGIFAICIVIFVCLSYIYHYKNYCFVDVTYNGQRLPLFEHSYNCGFKPNRLTERCLEIAIAKTWIKNIKSKNEKIIEIGAVTPYYFHAVDDVCDPADPHQKVNLKTSMFSLNLKNKNVLSISTIEHIGLKEYGIPVVKNESAIAALNKILSESKACLVTFPVGWNKDLDNYVLCREFCKRFSKVKTHFYFRNTIDNAFTEVQDYKIIKNITYGPNTANAVVILEKE